MLKLLADEQPRHTRELSRLLAERFKLSEEERRTLLPSGGQTYMVNRTGWAGFHLDRAGLVTRPKRATWQITPAGLEMLKFPPQKLDLVALLKIPVFAEFYRNSAKNRVTSKEGSQVDAGPEADAPPEEVIDQGDKIKKVDVRGTWSSELRDFTRWLPVAPRNCHA